ncbi:hypothetical protein DBB42_11025 [Pseudomonas plecoglossicida]|uniref:Uncharacterized protein n=1 Tax=Pseudomonas plecoglossicida TaxID=70775 RepID=A0A2R7UJ89_PSEDL|nr:hypothetical protein DBB42_11025 [Pseudomonas plecoglossicida]
MGQGVRGRVTDHSLKWKKMRQVPHITVGAGMPANTGAAGAIHRVACFAGMPAPTGLPDSQLLTTSSGPR